MLDHLACQNAVEGAKFVNLHEIATNNTDTSPCEPLSQIPHEDCTFLHQCQSTEVGQ